MLICRTPLYSYYIFFFFLVNYIFGLDDILEREREREREGGKRRTGGFRSWDMKWAFGS